MKNWTEIPDVELYSDGGAEPNPGKGGFGVILSYNGRKKEFSQGYEFTTNNRMELMGVIFGLKQLKTKCNVQVYSDSKYVVDGITKGWAEKWERNGWIKEKNRPALNSDLWEMLLDLISKHNVEFNWVKGHAGHIENERCDVLANEAINSEELLKDNEYELNSVDNVQHTFTKVTTTTKSKHKVEFEGDQCRKCSIPVIKKTPKKRKIKPNQPYYFEYYLFCPSCKTMYMTEDGKRIINTENNLF